MATDVSRISNNDLPTSQRSKLKDNRKSPFMYDDSPGEEL